MRTSWNSQVAAVAITVLTLTTQSCYMSPYGGDDTLSSSSDSPPTSLSLDPVWFSELDDLSANELLNAVSLEFGVPAELMAGLGWVQTGFVAPGQGSGRFGWLAVDETMISEAAQHTAISVEQLTSSRAGTLVVAAVQLSLLRQQLAPTAHPGEVDHNWYSVVRAWSRHTRPWLADTFAQEVFATLQRGLIAPSSDAPDPDQPDVIVVTPREIPGLSEVAPEPWPESGLEADYPGAVRLSEAPNSTARAGQPLGIELRASALSWTETLQRTLNDSSAARPHYVVRRTDGWVAQTAAEDREGPGLHTDYFVLELAASPDSYVSWTPQVMESSARLAGYLAWRYEIPIHAGALQGDLGDDFPEEGWLEAARCFRDGGESSCLIPTGGPEQADDPAGEGARGGGAPSGAAVSVPYFYQYANSYHPSASCQNTSIAMVLKWAGWSGTPDTITARFGKDLAQSPAGLASVFNQLAEESGLSARLQARTSGSISGLRGLLAEGKPVIVHGYLTSYGHVVVATGFDGNQYTVNDPAGRWAQTWKGGYPYGWNSTIGRGIRYSATRFEQAIATSNGSSSRPLWYHELSGVAGGLPEDLSSGGPSSGGGSSSGDSSGSSSSYPWADVEILSPSNGAQVGGSFPASAERVSGKIIEFWSGARRLSPALTANPAGSNVSFDSGGLKPLTAKNISQWGTLLATETVKVNVGGEGGADEGVDSGGLTIHTTPLGGTSYMVTSTSTVAGVAYVEYRVDGYLLVDSWSGASRHYGEGFPLDYSFSSLGVRTIQGRGFSALGELLAEGATTITVSVGAKVAQCSVVGTVSCGGTFSGDTSSALASDVINGYPTIVGNYEGPEMGVSWSGGVTGEVRVALVDPNATVHDLDILVLAQSSAECVPANVVARAFNSVRFDADGGPYIFVVDGFAGDAGVFEISLDCDP